MNVIKYLLDLNIKYIVFDQKLKKSLIIQNAYNLGIECISVLDARSATYYATGIAAQSKEKVVVFISAANSRSAFSGMTEAFYRKLPVILITLGKAFNYSTELKDVVKKHYVFTLNEKMDNVYIDDGPIHIELIEPEKTDSYEEKYTSFLVKLENIVQKKQYLYISRNINVKNLNVPGKIVYGGIENCDAGAISNVLGASLAKSRTRYIGVLSEEEYLHDMNALGNININDLLLYFIISKKDNNIICDYSKSMGFEVFRKSLNELDEQEMLSAIRNGKRTVFFVYEEG
ncbi:hypothetical protein NXH76_13415 [Blautia schinkii]|nr:hypothetical protein [Blautia schinkii]